MEQKIIRDVLFLYRKAQMPRSPISLSEQTC